MTYFILVDNQQQGPYTLEELRSRNVTSATLVWTEGMADWTPAWQVAELQPLFRSNSESKATTPPPAPSAAAPSATGAAAMARGAQDSYGAAAPAAGRQDNYGADMSQFEEQTQATSASEGEERHHHGHGLRNGCVVLLVALAAALVGLVATCPTADDHREAITKEINRVVEHAAEKSGGGDAWGMIGSMITKNIVGVVVDNMIEVDNYGVCSVGSITFKGKKKQVSFGILGHVFTFDADDIERALSKGGDNGDIFSSPLNNPGDGDDGSGSSESQPSDDQPSDDGSSVGNGDDDGSAASPYDDGSNDGSGSDDGTADGTVDF